MILTNRYSKVEFLLLGLGKGVGRKFSREEQRKKQGRKIAPLSLSTFLVLHFFL